MLKSIYAHLKNILTKVKRRLRDRQLEKAARALYAEYARNPELTAFSELFETEDL